MFLFTQAGNIEKEFEKLRQDLEAWQNNRLQNRVLPSFTMDPMTPSHCLYDVYLVTLRVSRSHQDRKHVRLEKMIRSSAQQAEIFFWQKVLKKWWKPVLLSILDIP